MSSLPVDHDVRMARARLSLAGLSVGDALGERFFGRDSVVERAISNARASIAGGHTIAEPLTESKVFPPMVCQMISVGETTGALDAMLGKIADFYDSEVDQTVANLMSLLEPMVILFLGVVIGGLVVAMYLPIFKLGSVIQ